MIYGFRNRETGDLLFGYTTGQGTPKKAFFNERKLAEEALDRYIQRTDLDIVEIGNEETKPKVKRPFDYEGRDLRAIQNARLRQDKVKLEELVQKFNEKEYRNTLVIVKEHGLLKIQFHAKK